MELFRKKRIEIVVEAPLQGRVATLIEQAGATGYTVLPALAGLGRGGPWREGEIIGTQHMVVVMTIVAPDIADKVLDALKPMLGRYTAILAVSDVDVVRTELF